MKPIKAIKPTNNVNDLIKQMGSTGFNARRLSKATDIVEKMFKDKECRNFLGLSGAMIPAGMTELVIEMIENEWIHGIVTTGANITHDLINAIGNKHYIGALDKDDAELRKKKIDRIYDVFMKDEVYESLEDFSQNVLKTLPKKKYSSAGLMKEFGKALSKKFPASHSWVRIAYENNVPIFCPSLPDCGFGMQIWLFKQFNELDVDLFLDWHEFVNELVWTAKRTGCLLIGGGVPKNFILQAQQFADTNHKYAVQLTTDSPQWGGLSGATLSEGISWGKISPDAMYQTVYGDATISLPLIISAVKERLKKK